MELRTLEYFLAVVREENITRAADVLHVTQPTLSRQMKDLEDELGTQLFVRGKYLHLTEAGVMLRRRAEEMMQLRDQIEEDLQKQEELSGTIRIGSGGLASSSILSEVICHFKDRYPRVTFDFYTNSADHVRDRLDHGLLDFGFLLEPIDISRYDYLRMKEQERWGLLLRTDHPLAAQKAITKDDLLSIPLITTNRLSLQQEITHWLGDDVRKPQIIGTYNIITNIATLVNDGIAAALTIEGAVRLMEGERLTFLPLAPELTMTSVLAWKKMSSMNGAAGRFLETVKSIHSAYTSI